MLRKLANLTIFVFTLLFVCNAAMYLEKVFSKENICFSTTNCQLKVSDQGSSENNGDVADQTPEESEKDEKSEKDSKDGKEDVLDFEGNSINGNLCIGLPITTYKIPYSFFIGPLRSNYVEIITPPPQTT